MSIAPSRSALGGVAVLMACACGLSSATATLLGSYGIGATTHIVHPLVLGVAAAAVVYGLWRTAKPSAHLALAAFAVLAVAAVLTPPMAMTSSAMPWSGTRMAGGALYVVAAAMLGYAFWRAFPTRQPKVAATAIGGAALATGCTCCMVTGAVAGMAVTAGASTQLESVPVLFWGGLAIVTAGLFRLGGLRAALWVPLGGLIVRYGPSLLGTAKVTGINPLVYPKYLITLVGTGAMMYGFAMAFRAARTMAPSSGGWMPTRSAPMREAMGAD